MLLSLHTFFISVCLCRRFSSGYIPEELQAEPCYWFTRTLGITLSLSLNAHVFNVGIWKRKPMHNQCLYMNEQDCQFRDRTCITQLVHVTLVFDQTGVQCLPAPQLPMDTHSEAAPGGDGAGKSRHCAWVGTYWMRQVSVSVHSKKWTSLNHWFGGSCPSLSAMWGVHTLRA